jgi:hypothetical protein
MSVEKLSYTRNPKTSNSRARTGKYYEFDKDNQLVPLRAYFSMR